MRIYDTWRTIMALNLDRTDRALLRLLQAEGRLTNAELPEFVV